MRLTEFLLQNISITVAMSAIIVLLFILSKLAGEKFTAKCRYVVWAVVMLRLAIPIGMGEGWLIRIELPAEEAEVTAEYTPPAPIQYDNIQAGGIQYNYTPAPSGNVSFQPAETAALPDPVSEYGEKELELPSLTEVLHIAAIVYLVGAVLYLILRLLSHYAYIRSIHRWRKLASDEIYKQYRKLCHDLGLKRVPVLYISTKADSPMLCGYFNTHIILPENISETAQIRGILHHELTHYRRGDLWLKLVCLFAESLHWFNPLVHLASRRCEQEMELACDETVLAGMSEKARVDYGRAMLEIVKQSQKNHSSLSARYIGLTTHYSPKKTAVRERFENILDTRHKRRGLYIMILAIILCAAAGLAVSCQIETGEAVEDESINEDESDLTESDYTELYSELQIFPHTSDVALTEMSDAELTEILENTLYKNAMTILDWVYLGQGLEINYENISQTYSTEALNYTLVENIENIDTLKNVCEVVFTAEFCEDHIYPIFFEGDSPLFVEENGHLYFNTNTGGTAAYAPDFTRAEIISNVNGVCRIKVPMTSPGDDEGTPYTYKIVVQDDYLVLDSFYFFAPDYTDETEADENTLPADPASAIISANPVGGNPKFLVFEDGLTYYVQNLADNSVTSSVLTLPEGYTDGKIVDGAAGGGSGEVILYVQTEANGCAAYIRYYFDTFTSVTEPAEVTMLDNEQAAKELKERIREKYPPSYTEQAILLTDQFVRYIMNEDWLEEGYEFTEGDIWYTLISLCAYDDELNHPYNTKLTLSNDNMYAIITLEDAQTIASELFGNTSWTQNSFTDEGFDYDENYYKTPLGLGLPYTIFASAEMTAIKENGMVYTNVHLVNSTMFPYEEHDYGYYTFVYRIMNGALRFEGVEKSDEASTLSTSSPLYPLTHALVTSDGAAAAEILGLNSEYAALFASVKVGSWTAEDIKRDTSLLLTMEVTESAFDLFPVGTVNILIENGEYGLILRRPNDVIEPMDDNYSNEQYAIYCWLFKSGIVEIPLHREMSAAEHLEFSKSATLFASIWADGSIESIKDVLKTCFGSDEFYTDSDIKTDNGTSFYAESYKWTVMFIDWLGDIENADGSITVNVKFYADPAKLFPAKSVAYTIREVGIDPYEFPIYSFEDCTVTEDHGIEPYISWIYHSLYVPPEEEVEVTVDSTSPIDEALQSYGLAPEESRYRFIKAFLTGDSTTLESMLWLEEGMGEVFKTLKFGDWSIKIDEDYEPNYEPFFEYMRPVELTVQITESGISTLPVGEHIINIYSDNYMYEIYLTIPTAVRNQYVPVEERSEAYKALLTWLGVNSKLIRFGTPKTVEDMEPSCSDIGDYLGNRYGAMPLEDYERLAEICFGTEVFEPYSPLTQNDDGTYYAGGHGGSSYQMDFISETENADGSVSIVIKYYADYCGLIESELVEYILRDTGEVYNENPVYAFEGMKVTQLSDFEPYYFIN